VVIWTNTASATSVSDYKQTKKTYH